MQRSIGGAKNSNVRFQSLWVRDTGTQIIFRVNLLGLLGERTVQFGFLAMLRLTRYDHIVF